MAKKISITLEQFKASAKPVFFCRFRMPDGTYVTTSDGNVLEDEIGGNVSAFSTGSVGVKATGKSVVVHDGRAITYQHGINSTVCHSKDENWPAVDPGYFCPKSE